MSKLYLDIETSGRDPAELEKFMPTEWPLGNLKDPVKIEAAKEEKKAEWLEKAALSAITGKIIAASVAVDEEEPKFMHEKDEKKIIELIVAYCDFAISKSGTIYTFNGDGFDLPMICQRAAVYGIPAFRKFTNVWKGRRSWDEAFCDVMKAWNMQYSWVAGANLKNIVAMLGVGEKVGDGKDFANLLATDFEAAKRYALADVDLLRKVVAKMGI